MPLRTHAPLFGGCIPGPSEPTQRIAANDNALPGLGCPLVRSALFHFAAYGLAAGEDANRRANAALDCGNHEQDRFWRQIGTLLGG